MAYLFTFVTERTDNLEALNQVRVRLSIYKILVTEYQVNDVGKEYIYLSGHVWEKDAEDPAILDSCFYDSGINCVFCNHYNFGLIDGRLKKYTVGEW